MIYLEQCDYDCLVKLFNNNSIILFGAGKAAKTAVQALKEMDEKFLNKIEFIVDNSQDKWNTFLKISEYNIPIVSPEKLMNDENHNKIIIVSSQYLEEIIEQLSGEPLLRSTKVVFYEDIRIANILNEFWMPDNIRITDKPLIPKVIHYCWFGKNPIPDRYKEWMSTWKKYCPDYEIVEWNEDNYDYKKNEYMYEAYKAKKWGFVPDYARLDIIYNYGGIYLDTDVELVKNLDDLLYQKAFAGIESSLSVANGLGFGAIPYLPNLKKQISVYDNRHFIKEDGTLDLTPAPVMQTEIMRQNGFIKNNKYQIVDDITIYPAPVLGGIIGSRVIIDDNVYAIHHYDASWRPKEWKEKQRNSRKRLNKKLSEYYNNRV